MEWAVILLTIIAVAASFKAGRIYERSWRKAQLMGKAVNLTSLRKHYDRRI